MRQVLDQDKRFTGALFSRRQCGAGEYSVRLGLKDGQEVEFDALGEFRSWHAQYRKARGSARGVRQRLPRVACKDPVMVVS